MVKQCLLELPSNIASNRKLRGEPLKLDQRFAFIGKLAKRSQWK
jgi:hypothetical protein